MTESDSRVPPSLNKLGIYTIYGLLVFIGAVAAIVIVIVTWASAAAWSWVLFFTLILYIVVALFGLVARYFANHIHDPSKAFAFLRDEWHGRCFLVFMGLWTSFLGVFGNPWYLIPLILFLIYLIAERA